jgi:hypothetical protein
MKSLPIALWIVVAALLVLAVLKLPYGYYSFLRIVVCAFCAFDTPHQPGQLDVADFTLSPVGCLARSSIGDP